MSLIKWECETYTPLPSLRRMLGTCGVDALIPDAVKRVVVYPPRRARNRSRKKRESRRGADSSATKFETGRVRPVPRLSCKLEGVKRFSAVV